MGFRDSMRRAFGNMSITVKFGLGIGLLLSLIVMVAATGWISMEFVRKAQESIEKSTEIQRLVLDMDRRMEKARRLHGDFHLQHPRIGLAKAHELYAQPSVRETAQVIKISNALRNLISQTMVGEELQRSHTDLNLYLSSAKRFADTSIQSVELATELAAPEWGLEPRMDNLLHALGKETAGIQKFDRLYEQIRSLTQDYRITRERHVMQSAFNAAFSLRDAALNDPNGDEGRKARIKELLDEYTNVAGRILDAETSIKAKFNDFALQSAAASAVSATLVKLADEEVGNARAKIERAHAMALLIMAAITLAGLLAATGIAVFLNKSITRRVVLLTQSAMEFQKGSLDAPTVREGMDELSRLNDAFAAMAARITQLIVNLEQEVGQRTSELGESERRFRLLFEHSSNGVVILDTVGDGKDFLLKDINRAGETIDGVKREQLRGRRVTECLPSMVEKGMLEAIESVWREGESIRHPITSYSNGALLSWRENHIYKLPTGEIVVVFDDLTAQKQAEIERLNMETKLQRAQKMETVGLLAGGVAHDLNNILSGIVGYPELLLLQIPEDSKLRAPIRAIRESGMRAAAVVADLLTVARGVARAKTTADLNDLVLECMDSPENMKFRMLHAGTECTTELHHEALPIHCSPVHIKKCIMNLVVNATEAVDDGFGRIVVATRQEALDERKAAKLGIQPGEYAVLSVKDNGKGISEEDMEHIFEPFYTKKIMGRSGTGLGLAVVWNSVMEHGGTVEVENSIDGTCFHLFFPISDAAEEVAREDENGGLAGLKGHGERILIVDDEAPQLDIASRMLKILGYDVDCAPSGELAIDYLRANKVDMVLLDMLMYPGINGRQTYERILEIHPGQKAIIVSGFSDSEDVQQAQRLGARGLIKKPYTIEQLGKTLKRALRD